MWRVAIAHRIIKEVSYRAKFSLKVPLIAAYGSLTDAHGLQKKMPHLLFEFLSEKHSLIAQSKPMKGGDKYTGPRYFLLRMPKIRVSMYNKQDNCILKCLQDLGLPGIIGTDETKYFLSPNNSVKGRLLGLQPLRTSHSLWSAEKIM